jgi:hypothetical protein
MSPGTYHWESDAATPTQASGRQPLLHMEQFRSALDTDSQEVGLHTLERHRRRGGYFQVLQVHFIVRFLCRLLWPESTTRRMNKRHTNVDTNLCFRYSVTLRTPKNKTVVVATNESRLVRRTSPSQVPPRVRKRDIRLQWPISQRRRMIQWFEVIKVGV